MLVKMLIGQRTVLVCKCDWRAYSKAEFIRHINHGLAREEGPYTEAELEAEIRILAIAGDETENAGT